MQRLADITPDRAPTLVESIATALHQEVARIIDEEAAEAGRRVVARVREQTGAITGRVLDHWTMERRGPEIIIRVNFEGDKKHG